MSKVVYGIDLGTSNSCVAKFENGEFELVNIDGRPTVPSVLAYDGDRCLVGQSAENYAQLNPEASARSVKRKMGSEYKFSMANIEYSPTELSSKILSYLKTQVYQELGLELVDVVITVPAWFDESQRQATVESAKLAELNVLRIINEPTAAALAYEASSECSKASNWLVYDLGGGTFDVSIVRVDQDSKEVLSSCGNTYLGGDDFDKKIEEVLLQKLKNEYSKDISQSIASMAKISKIAQETKIKLSTETEVKIDEVIQFEGSVLNLNLLLTRSEFEDLIRSYIESSLDKVQQALDEAKLGAEQIQRLLLVGGSTRIPMIADLLKERFDLDADTRVNADTSVALGAAVQAAIFSKLTYSQIVVDIAPHNLGVAANGKYDYTLDPFDMMEREHPLTFSPIIMRNTKIPSRFIREFYTGVDNQKQVEIAVYQGESELTTKNTFIGSFCVDIEPMPARSSVYIGFEYDINAMIQISVSKSGDVESLKKFKMNLNDSSRNNSEKTDGIVEVIPELESDSQVEESADVMNFLIEKVQKKLKITQDKQEVENINATVSQYKTALGLGDDIALDRLEEDLYNWIESQEVQEPEVGNL